jgi:tRNA pseudouridine55 synthase
MTKQTDCHSFKQLNGLLAVHKPVGMISKDVSRWLVRRLGRQKLGHVGTLDPLAEGVLPILFGKATRFQDHLLFQKKAYEVELTFGRATDTLDRDGVFVAESSFDHVTKELIEAALPQFVGRIEQVPPLYSAVKFQGKALYRYSREGSGDAVPLNDLKREVDVYSACLVHFADGKAVFRVSCGKGTYIRVLVSDLAAALGTCGYVSSLKRTEAAGVSLKDALTLEEIEASILSLESLLLPIEKMNHGLPSWQSSQVDWVQKLRAGQELYFENRVFSDSFFHDDEEVRSNLIADTVLLVGPNGRAFGFGRASRERQHQVTLAMKRGL